MATFNDVKVGQAFKFKDPYKCIPYGIKISPITMIDDWTCIGEDPDKAEYNVIYVTGDRVMLANESLDTEVETVNEIKFIHTY